MIGTGASAIQFVPAIQPEVERLHVFQRTPPWVMPHATRRSPARARALPPLPVAQRAIRTASSAGRELLVPGFAQRPADHGPRARCRAGTCAARSPTRSCARKLTPDYTIGCKRILISNDYYPALTPAERRRSSRTRSARSAAARSSRPTGRSAEVDTIILGTGFQVTDFPVGRLIHGRGGRPLPSAGAAARARTSARPSPASPTCSSCSARTPASATARSST